MCVCVCVCVYACACTHMHVCGGGHREGVGTDVSMTSGASYSG